MVIFHWRGIDVEGRGRKGSFEAASPFAFVRDCFDSGWRELVVDVAGRPGAAPVTLSMPMRTPAGSIADCAASRTGSHLRPPTERTTIDEDCRGPDLRARARA